jgi:hypothetical protein
MSRFAVVYEDPEYEYNPEDEELQEPATGEELEEQEYYGA